MIRRGLWQVKHKPDARRHFSELTNAGVSPSAKMLLYHRVLHNEGDTMDFLLGGNYRPGRRFCRDAHPPGDRGESPLPPAPKLTKPHKVRPAVRDEDADYDG